MNTHAMMVAVTMPLAAATLALGQQTVDQAVDPTRVIIARPAPTTGYQPRVGQTVYDTGTVAQTGGDYRSGSVTVYDDVTFAGPALVSPVVRLRDIGAGLYLPPGTQVPDTTLYIRTMFYPDHSNAVANNAHPYSGTPVVMLSEAVYGGEDGSLLVRPNALPVVLDSTNVFSSPGDLTCGVKMELFDDAAMSTRSVMFNFVRRGGYTTRIGASDIYGWFVAFPPFRGDLVNSDRNGSTASNRGTFLTLSNAVVCSADFNNDGDTGTDQDIEAFFACLSGSCCPTCPGNADFNDDGDTGTDADIESFFRVLAGGAC